MYYRERFEFDNVHSSNLYLEEEEMSKDSGSSSGAAPRVFTHLLLLKIQIRRMNIVKLKPLPIVHGGSDRLKSSLSRYYLDSNICICVCRHCFLFSSCVNSEN